MQMPLFLSVLVPSLSPSSGSVSVCIFSWAWLTYFDSPTKPPTHLLLISVDYQLLLCSIKAQSQSQSSPVFASSL